MATATHEAESPPCPLCRRSIVAGDSAGLHAGRVFHLDCYISVLRASGELLSFFKSRAGEPFCRTCLVNTIDVTFDEAALAHAWLRARPGMRFDVAPCAGCGGRRVTLAYSPCATDEAAPS